VTRDSVLALCREWNNFQVSERHFSIDEVIAAVQEGRVRFVVVVVGVPRGFRRTSDTKIQFRC